MWVEILLLALAFPIGYLIAWMARDELVSGRKWFKAIIGLSIMGAVIFLVLREWTALLTLGFIVIVSGISLWKSKDSKWTKYKNAR
jgi:CHASE2 domain-containing sensor protein